MIESRPFWRIVAVDFALPRLASLAEGFVEGLRAATRGDWALGDARFETQINDPS